MLVKSNCFIDKNQIKKKKGVMKGCPQVSSFLKEYVHGYRASHYL